MILDNFKKLFKNFYFLFFILFILWMTYAREKYLMKKESEDIFYIIEE